MVFDEKDFWPANDQWLECGCENHGTLIPCSIFYVDEKKHRHRVCFRQQCQKCGFVRKNKMGKILYYTIVDSISPRDMFNFLPEFFWAPDEFTYDENRQYDRKKKIDFMRRILTLANRNEKSWGHLDFTREEIEAVQLNKKIA